MSNLYPAVYVDKVNKTMICPPCNHERSNRQPWCQGLTHTMSHIVTPKELSVYVMTRPVENVIMWHCGMKMGCIFSPSSANGSVKYSGHCVKSACKDGVHTENHYTRNGTKQLKDYSLPKNMKLDEYWQHILWSDETKIWQTATGIPVVSLMPKSTVSINSEMPSGKGKIRKKLKLMGSASDKVHHFFMELGRMTTVAV